VDFIPEICHANVWEISSFAEQSGLRMCFLVAGFVFDVLNQFPKSAHPMTQLTAGIMALQVPKFSSMRLGFVHM
jgi:hypothetical protein